MTPLKKCTKCGEEKPATTEFWHVMRTGKYGVRAICRVCRSKPRELIEGICETCGSTFKYLKWKTTKKYCSRKCHPSVVNTGGQRKQYQKEYKAVNRDKIKYLNRQWYLNNKERARTNHKRYRARNKETIRARSRKYHAENKDKEAAYYEKRKKSGLVKPYGDHDRMLARERIQKLSDGYIRKKLGVSGQVPPEWIELKRATIKLKRLINEKQREIKSSGNHGRVDNVLS